MKFKILYRTAQIYIITNALGFWEVGEYFRFVTSNPNCINACCVLSRALEDGNPAIWRIFSWDSRSFNKIFIASALRLPNSPAIGNYR
jgi:hypothetical protein